MEQEQILSTLKEKLGTTSLSDRTIGNYVARHLPAQGTEPDESYFNSHVAELKAFAADYTGQHNNETAAARKNWEDEWNKSHPVKVETKPTEGGNEEIAKLQKQIDDMKAESLKNKQILDAETLKTSLKGKSTELKVSNKALWDDVVASTQVATGSTEETLLETVKKSYEAKLKAYNGDGAKPYASSKAEGQSADEQKEAKARREAFLERMRAAGKLPKKSE